MVAAATLQRWLGPIYHLIDEGDLRKAVKAIQKEKTRKQRMDDALYAQMLDSLEAYCHMRQGDTDEGLSLARGLCNNPDLQADSALIHTLMMVLRIGGAADELAAPLARLVETPAGQDMELFEMLFVAYIAQGDFTKQQRLAMRMAKLFPTRAREMGFRAAAALYFQLPADVEADAPLLRLGLMMMEKARAEGHFENLEELRLFVLFLERKRDWAAIRELYDAEDMGRRLFKIESERLEAIAACDALAGESDRARTEYVELIRKFDADNWSWYVALFDAGGSVADLADAPTTAQGGYPARSPLLMHVEAGKRAGDAVAVAEAIVAYYAAFGNKPCFLNDCRPFLATVRESDAAVKTLLDGLAAKDDGSQLRRRIGRAQVAWALTREAGPYTLDALDDMLAVYRENLEDRPKGGKETIAERQPSDDLLILAAHMLRARGTDTDLVRAIDLLEKGLEPSEYNYQFKLWLVELYTRMGAASRVNDIWRRMGIKYVMNDTLSYLVLDDSIRLGRYTDAIVTAQLIIQFHNGSETELPDMIRQGYTNGSYHKTADFVKFHDRLRHAHQLAVAVVEMALIRFHLAMSSFKAASESICSTPRYAPNGYTDEKVVDALRIECDLTTRVDLDILGERKETDAFAGTTDFAAPAASSLNASVKVASRETKMTLLRMRSAVCGLLMSAEAVASKKDNEKAAADFAAALAVLESTHAALAETVGADCLDLQMYGLTIAAAKLVAGPAEDADFDAVAASATSLVAAVGALAWQPGRVIAALHQLVPYHLTWTTFFLTAAGMRMGVVNAKGVFAASGSGAIYKARSAIKDILASQIPSIVKSFKNDAKQWRTANVAAEPDLPWAKLSDEHIASLDAVHDIVRVVVKGS